MQSCRFCLKHSLRHREINELFELLIINWLTLYIESFGVDMHAVFCTLKVAVMKEVRLKQKR
jgi:hypothetical protein